MSADSLVEPIRRAAPAPAPFRAAEAAAFVDLDTVFARDADAAGATRIALLPGATAGLRLLQAVGLRLVGIAWPVACAGRPDGAPDRALRASLRCEGIVLDAIVRRAPGTGTAAPICGDAIAGVRDALRLDLPRSVLFSAVPDDLHAARIAGIARAVAVGARRGPPAPGGAACATHAADLLEAAGAIVTEAFAAA